MVKFFRTAQRGDETGKRENGRVRAKGQNEGIVASYRRERRNLID